MIALFKKYGLLFCILLTAFASCKKEGIGPQSTESTNHTNIDTTEKQVFIINEGNYTWGNGSVDIYYSERKITRQGVFQFQNNASLGDVPQSMTIYGNTGFIVVNNSQKIEVVNISNMGSIATIIGLTSPRYLLVIDSLKGYVTDLYADGITILDLKTYLVKGKIAIAGWTEQLVKVGNQVFVTNMDNNLILLIDAITDVYIDNIEVADSPNSIVVDANNQLWVLCSGGFKETYPVLYKINTTSFSIVDAFIFKDINNSPNNLKINSDGTTLYFLNQDVYRMEVSDTALPAQPFITSTGLAFYGLGIDPESEDIYLTDAADYVQQGRVFRYNSSGTQIDEFSVGIIPGHIAF